MDEINKKAERNKPIYEQYLQNVKVKKPMSKQAEKSDVNECTTAVEEDCIKHSISSKSSSKFRYCCFIFSGLYPS